MEECVTLADEDEADELETLVLRPLVWLGKPLRNLRAFPAEAKKIIGDKLQLIQFGGMPRDAKPFKGIGSGVFEIALRHDSGRHTARCWPCSLVGTSTCCMPFRKSRRRASPRRSRMWI